MLTGSEKQMFPGERGARTMSNNTILYAQYRMGYKGDMTGPGFRGVAATILNGQGWDEKDSRFTACPHEAETRSVPLTIT